MNEKGNLCSFNHCGCHKGFYNDGNIIKSLCDMRYMDFLEYIDDNEFPCDTALSFLYGSCNYFAVNLQKMLGYTPYIIEGKDCESFHAFCQIYKKKHGIMLMQEESHQVSPSL